MMVDSESCTWPQCSAKDDADRKHSELREDLKDIKQSQHEAASQFRELAVTMTKVASLRDDFQRIEKKHDEDIKGIREDIDKKVSHRELAVYGGIIVVAMGIVQFVIILLAK